MEIPDDLSENSGYKVFGWLLNSLDKPNVWSVYRGKFGSPGRHYRCMYVLSLRARYALCDNQPHTELYSAGARLSARGPTPASPACSVGFHTRWINQTCGRFTEGIWVGTKGSVYPKFGLTRFGLSRVYCICIYCI